MTRGWLGLPAEGGAWIAAIVAGLCAARFDAREVRAGDYHDGATLDCSQCHVMHGARARSQGASLSAPAAQSAGPLLRRDVNDLCLSCHDGSTRAVDVLGRNQGRSPGDVRQAGSLNRLGRVGSPATGHTLDSTDVAPGSSPPWRAEDENGTGHGLSCINCHAPHGVQGEAPAYRNLRSDAGNNARGEGLVTCNAGGSGANDLTRDVYVRRALDYDESAVDFNEPDRSDSAMARFCAGCHDRFHGIPGVDAEIGGRPHGASLSGFVRHPASGVDVGAIGGDWSRIDVFLSRANRVKVMSAMGAWNSGGGQLTPTCISCHKAHGNDNEFGLIFRSGQGVLTEEGDGGGRGMEDLCRQCHAPGGAAP